MGHLSSLFAVLGDRSGLVGGSRGSGVVAYAAAGDRMRSTFLTLMLTAVLAVSLMPGVALASHNRADENPCADAPRADFADYDQARSAHRNSIDCALYRAITSGAGTNGDDEPVYKPRNAMTRAQMAQFIVNALVAGGYDDALPSGGGDDEFSDIEDNFARPAINRLARAEIVSGTGQGDRYAPDGFVSRKQMATFVVQAARFAVGEGHPVRNDGDDRFRDVSNDNVHKQNIEAGADAELFRGTTETTFSPGARVQRDQMATFLVNLLGYIFDPDLAPPPNAAALDLDSTTVAAGDELTGAIEGSNIDSVSVEGCGLNGSNLNDSDSQADGIQFKVRIPANQDAGECELTFRVTFDNSSVRRLTETITVGGENRASVTLTKNEVNPGEAVTGTISGNNLKSVSVSGCGLVSQPAEDRNTNDAGVQFSETIPAAQPVGACTLTFAVTYSDGETTTLTAPLSIVERTGVTTRPELIGADVVSTSASGTTVRYLFDEPVTGGTPTANRFLLYAFDATAESGSNPRIEPGNTRSVLVSFPNVTTTDEVEDFTVAAVEDSAVTDDQGQSSPQGDVPIGTQREETVRQPGATAAPDLQEVASFRRAGDDMTAVDFTFDEAAFVVNPDGFNLVLVDGTNVTCEGPPTDSSEPGGTTDAGGNGTTRITVICANPSDDSGSTPLTATTVARGYVEAATVSDLEQDVSTVNDEIEGNVNPLQAATVAEGATTIGPDLVSAQFTPGEGSADDQVVYTFDEVIFPLEDESPVTGAPTNRFQVYDTTGEEFQAETATRGSNTREVIATFENGVLADAVGASVRAGAVTAGTGSGQGEANDPDEVGVTNSTTRTISPGDTAAPDLQAAAVNPQDGSASYTFDEAVNPAPAGDEAIQPMDFYLFLSNGIELQCVGVPGTPTFTVNDNTVTCSQYRQGNSQATDAQVGSAVLATVAAGAVDDDEDGITKNPPGAEPTTGGTGSPEQ